MTEQVVLVGVQTTVGSTGLPPGPTGIGIFTGMNVSSDPSATLRMNHVPDPLLSLRGRSRARQLPVSHGFATWRIPSNDPGTAPKGRSPSVRPNDLQVASCLTCTEFDPRTRAKNCLLYTSDAADDLTRVDLGGRRLIKKKKIR